jgi:hypothetical protein
VEATYLVGLLIGALVGAGLTFLMAELPIVATIGMGLVTDCETFAGNYANQQSQTENWTSWVSAFSYWEAGPSDEFAAMALSGAWGAPSFSQTASFAFALAALAMGWYGESTPGGMIASDGSVVLTGVSVALELKASTEGASGEEPGTVKLMDAAIVCMDVGAAGIDIYSWLSGR